MNRLEKESLGMRARDIVDFVTILARPFREDLAYERPAESLTWAMACAKFGFDELELLSLGVSLPLHDALQRCRESPPEGWPTKAYKLVGRIDLALVHTLNKTGHESGRLWSDVSCLAFWRHKYALLFSDNAGTSIEFQGTEEEAIHRSQTHADDDGFATVSRYFSILLGYPFGW